MDADVKSLNRIMNRIMDADVKSLNRQWALDAYNAGKSNSNRRHKQGDPKYGPEYVRILPGMANVHWVEDMKN